MITNKTIKSPRISLVGAGPGDAELISLKGVRILRSADVVLYDALVNNELLDFAPESAIKIYVGKRSGDHSYSQQAVNKLMVDYARNYGHVVRLKGGDPFVFGRGFEELEVAAAHHIPAEVIPGISSSISVPALQGIPVTHRGVNESFWVITGTTTSGEIAQDLFTAAKTDATVIVLMGVKKLKEIAAIYEAEGKGALPAAVIQNGSLPDEKIAVGTVSTIVGIAEEQKIGSPALIVLGRVVSLHSLYKPVGTLFECSRTEQSI
jgi:uroporphyrin-III C-methyltransferase